MGRAEVVFSWVLDNAASEAAWAWYKCFAENDPHIFPRGEQDYRELLDNGQVVSACENGVVLGLAYYTREALNTWEIGGLMVGDNHQKRGIGGVLARVVLGHLLFDETPFDCGHRVISHVHAENNAPRRLLQALGFKKSCSVTVPGTKLPGLKTNEVGMVEGDELELSPDSLKILSQWCAEWPHQLSDRSLARINLGEGITLDLWSEAFELMGSSV